MEDEEELISRLVAERLEEARKILRAEMAYHVRAPPGSILIRGITHVPTVIAERANGRFVDSDYIFEEYNVRIEERFLIEMQETLKNILFEKTQIQNGGFLRRDRLTITYEPEVKVSDMEECVSEAITIVPVNDCLSTIVSVELEKIDVPKFSGVLSGYITDIIEEEEQLELVPDGTCHTGNNKKVLSYSDYVHLRGNTGYFMMMFPTGILKDNPYSLSLVMLASLTYLKRLQNSESAVFGGEKLYKLGLLKGRIKSGDDAVNFWRAGKHEFLAETETDEWGEVSLSHSV